jgi:holo-[acyl-carrier protein] synthase
MLCTGVDLVEINRIQGTIERYGDRFLKRVYTQQELAEVGNNYASLAARFAAKEAVSKALGRKLKSGAVRPDSPCCISRGQPRSWLTHWA